MLDVRIGAGDFEDTTVIAYDDGTHKTWWCSDKDSFGAAVRFTPAAYPCYVVGARAEVGYDIGQEVYLRVFDDDGAGGLPGAALYEQQRLDIPQGVIPGTGLMSSRALIDLSYGRADDHVGPFLAVPSLSAGMTARCARGFPPRTGTRFVHRCLQSALAGLRAVLHSEREPVGHQDSQ